MGVRKEGSGKSRTKTVAHGMDVAERGAGSGASANPATAAGAAGGRGAGGDPEEDSDSELQEVYVQAYACQVFSDDAAAKAVEDGAHLRPLTVPQDPEGEPLMLDRFDARWMLDLADFNKGTGYMPAALSVEENEVDSLRYAGLPSGDHSVEVEGLGLFAPTGSYAHGRNRGGLGDEEEQEETVEVYGYYGRTASPPPPARGAWAATPAPHASANGSAPARDVPPSFGGVESEAASGVVERAEAGKSAKVEGEEGFVPDFGVPPGIGIPSSVRQHMMMVGTARTVVRSPQLEVLLRLKQASNPAFSFLSHDDHIHPYYAFLKSWGEAALAAEYSRQQRLQKERAEAREKGEENERAAPGKGP